MLIWCINEEATKIAELQTVVESKDESIIKLKSKIKSNADFAKEEKVKLKEALNAK